MEVVQPNVPPLPDAPCAEAGLSHPRIILFVVLITISSGLAASGMGRLTGWAYGRAYMAHPLWDPPVGEFLASCGRHAGMLSGLAVGLAFCRRLRRWLREAGGAVPRVRVCAAGARLGAFAGLIAALVLHGTLWMAAGFAAPREPMPISVHLVVLGAACGLVAGVALGLLGGYLVSRLGTGGAGESGVVRPMPGVLGVRLRWAIPIAAVVAFLSAVAGLFFGGAAAMGYQTLYASAAWGVGMNDRPDLVTAGTVGDWVEAVSYRPFLAPLGRAVGLGSGLLVAAMWLWAMMARRVPRLRRALVLGSLLGIVAGVSSTWLLHQALATTVGYDVSRLWAGASMFRGGLFFGIPTGALVGLVGSVSLVLVGRCDAGR